MAVLAVAFGLALCFDPSTVEGVPAWLKPAKFAVSLSLYGFTFAWILRHLPTWTQTVRWSAWATTTASLVELGLIALQAARGVPSHFNTRTPFDASVFGIMGFVIAAQTVAATAVAIALWRHSFSDRAHGLALQLGLSLSVLGSGVGGIMVRPSPLQHAEASSSGRLARSGSHSIGGPDGGPSLPGLRWSTQHGDLRVAHFVGLHAMQWIPLVAFLTRRWRSMRSRVTVVVGAAASYACVFAILLAQALLGQPVTAPTGWILQALFLWVVATIALATYAWHVSRRDPPRIPSLKRNPA